MEDREVGCFESRREKEGGGPAGEKGSLFAGDQIKLASVVEKISQVAQNLDHAKTNPSSSITPRSRPSSRPEGLAANHSGRSSGAPSIQICRRSQLSAGAQTFAEATEDQNIPDIGSWQMSAVHHRASHSQSAELNATKASSTISRFYGLSIIP